MLALWIPIKDKVIFTNTIIPRSIITKILNHWIKVNNNDDSLDCLYKWFFFWQKEQEKIGKYTAKLTFLWYDILVEKRVSAEEWHDCHSKNVLASTILSLGVRTIVREVERNDWRWEKVGVAPGNTDGTVQPKLGAESRSSSSFEDHRHCTALHEFLHFGRLHSGFKFAPLRSRITSLVVADNSFSYPRIN